MVRFPFGREKVYKTERARERQRERDTERERERDRERVREIGLPTEPLEKT